MKWRDDDYDALRYAQWEQEQNRPFDWQDKLVMWAGWICFCICLGILFWGK